MSGSFLHLARVRRSRLYVQSPPIVNKVTLALTPSPSPVARGEGSSFPLACRSGRGVARQRRGEGRHIHHKPASTGGSILPPLMIAPARPISGGRRPASRAARGPAPDGSAPTLSPSSAESPAPTILSSGETQKIFPTAWKNRE